MPSPEANRTGVGVIYHTGPPEPQSREFERNSLMRSAAFKRASPRPPPQSVLKLSPNRPSRCSASEDAGPPPYRPDALSEAVLCTQRDHPPDFMSRCAAGISASAPSGQDGPGAFGSSCVDAVGSRRRRTPCFGRSQGIGLVPRRLSARLASRRRLLDLSG